MGLNGRIIVEAPYSGFRCRNKVLIISFTKLKEISTGDYLSSMCPGHIHIIGKLHTVHFEYGGLLYLSEGYVETIKESHVRDRIMAAYNVKKPPEIRLAVGGWFYTPSRDAPDEAKQYIIYLHDDAANSPSFEEAFGNG